jgi:lipopolysaccharide export system permease protein
VIVAREATFENLMWNLSGGIVHKFDERGGLNYEAAFDQMKIFVNEDLINCSSPKTPEEMSSRELKMQIEGAGQRGKRVAELKTDYYMKFSIPLTCFIFALVGIPLSLPSIRSGKTWGLTLSIVVMFTFYVFASVFRSMGRGAVVTPWVAAWGPQFLFGVFGLILLLREGFKK